MKSSICRSRSFSLEMVHEKSLAKIIFISLSEMMQFVKHKHYVKKKMKLTLGNIIFWHFVPVHHSGIRVFPATPPFGAPW